MDARVIGTLPKAKGPTFFVTETYFERPGYHGTKDLHIYAVSFS